MFIPTLCYGSREKPHDNFLAAVWLTIVTIVSVTCKIILPLLRRHGRTPPRIPRLFPSVATWRIRAAYIANSLISMCNACNISSGCNACLP